MRVRHIVSEEKKQETETKWRTDDLQKRYAPFYVKTRPMPRGWRWKSAKASSGDTKFVLLAQCNPSRAKWQAILAKEIEDGFAVIARLEDHGSHQGVHIHTDCEKSGLVSGAVGLDGLSRIPEAKKYHRRAQSWTEDGFWNAARQFFRISGEDRESPVDDAQWDLGL